MPNIAVVLRQEICRLAKSEIKSQISSTKQAVVQYRRDIAGLKRQLREQGKEIAFLKAQEQKRWAGRRRQRKHRWRASASPPAP